MTERYVLFRALKNFGDFQVGDDAWLVMTRSMASLVAQHYLKVMWDPAWEVTSGNREDLQDRPDEEGQGSGDDPGASGPAGD